MNKCFIVFLLQLLLEERLDGATLLVMANKQDLPGAASVDEIQKLLGLDDITTHHWSIRGCSGRTNFLNLYQRLISGVRDESSSLNGHLKWLTGDVASRCFSRDQLFNKNSSKTLYILLLKSSRKNDLSICLIHVYENTFLLLLLSLQVTDQFQSLVVVIFIFRVVIKKKHIIQGVNDV